MIQIGAIQILRAIAALMVVFSHAQNDAWVAALKHQDHFTRLTLLPWDAGVDLFFVISGFIMVYSSQRLFATSGASGAFMSRRLIRIVPLYWLITGIGLVLSAYLAWLGKHAFPNISEILASFGFIPFARPEDGQPRPLVAQGWTLNYEMLFYVIFALTVGFRRSVAVTATSLILVLMIIAGAVAKPTTTVLAYWSDPIILEFILGMSIALLWRGGVRFDLKYALLLLSSGIALLVLDIDQMTKVGAMGVDNNGFGRLFGAGVPMAIIFAAVVLRAPSASPTSGRTASFLALIGDASYALYLFHPLAIISVRKFGLALGLTKSLGFWPLIAAEILVALALCVAVHALIENPVTAALRQRFIDRDRKSEQREQMAEPQGS
ncbi:MAG: acyltransferase [Pseudomonadota bacterium]